MVRKKNAEILFLNGINVLNVFLDAKASLEVGLVLPRICFI